MYKYIFPVLSLIVLLQYSCRQNSVKQLNATGGQNLFPNKNEDTSLFAKHTVALSSQLTTDSACKSSGLLAVCTPLSVDSTVHQSEKASFYLVKVKIDTVLKGTVDKSQDLYFTIKKIPHFQLGTAGWMLYLDRQKTGKLLMHNNGIPWQWVDNAPFEKYNPATVKVKVLPRHKIKRKSKKKRPVITLWVVQ